MQGVCFTFQKGNCNRGNGCRFSHDGIEIRYGGGRDRSNRSICYDFQKEFIRFHEYYIILC
jgi:hypothetical protein